MEKTFTLIKAHAAVQRPYTDKNGQPQVFVSRGFELSDGIDTLYAEMQGDLARVNANTAYQEGGAYRVQLQMSLRRYTDAQGCERFSNEVRIIKIA